MTVALAECHQLDQQDPLRHLRDLFFLPEGVIYLDGNSLGPMPKAAAAAVQHAVHEEWATGLIRSWGSAHWFDLPRTLGDALAPLLGARSGEVIVSDSTGINLYKALYAAIRLQQEMPAKAGAAKKVLLTERTNFPTDLYIAQTLAEDFGLQLQLLETDEVADKLQSMIATQEPSLAILLLTEVNYRTGYKHDMKQLTQWAHQLGALTVWDLAHSAGAIPVDLHAANADFAVGCTYKYLTGGPGSPAFIWVHPRHVDQTKQPLSGWWGHANPFAMKSSYQASAGIGRYLCGTQPILSMQALSASLTVFQAAEALGGMQALRQKSLALTDLFMQRVDARLASHGIEVVTPRAHALRGSQVSLTNHQEPNASYPLVQALIAQGIIGDFRAAEREGDPPIMRFGFAPLYVGFADVWHAVDALSDLLASGEWRKSIYHQNNAVT